MAAIQKAFGSAEGQVAGGRCADLRHWRRDIFMFESADA